jgi:hypothetical protein
MDARVGTAVAQALVNAATVGGLDDSRWPRYRRISDERCDWEWSPMTWCRSFVAVMVAAATAAMTMPPVARADVPRLNTNQSYQEEAARRTALDPSDPMAVFAFVIDGLPERVKVYPTENYYYFSFLHNGVPYAGNIRLDASNRDEGKVSFGYFEEYGAWKPDVAVTFRLLDRSNGVVLEKVDRFLYRLTYGGKSVLFELNDLSAVKPPKLAADEIFIGPICDDSAMRFFLLFNRRLKIFLYVLDETAPVPDAFLPLKRTDRILIGKRTAFAFYRDQRVDRKILIGVYMNNIEANNYFDGPFDQLPDNFIEGEILRHAILAVDPSLKGKIDRFGGSADGAERFMISPYLAYQKTDELMFFHQCATSPHTQAAQYYRCFSLDDTVKLETPPRSRPGRSKKTR